MSRLFEALHRATQDGDTAAPTQTADADLGSTVEENALTQFETGNDPVGTASDFGEVVEPPRAPAALSVNRQSSAASRALTVRPIRERPTSARDVAENEIRIRDVLEVIARHWMWIAALIIIAVSLAAAYNAVAVPVYEARARMIIDPEARQVVPFRQEAQDTSRFDYFLTQLEILRSGDLTRKTLERLGSGENSSGRSRQIGPALGSLSVTPSNSQMGLSRVVNLTVQSTDPELAAQVVNAHMLTYIEQNLETRRQGAREATQWLNERLDELRRQVNSRQGALQTYREQKDAVSLEDRQNIVVQKLAQLNTTFTTARTERVDKEVLYHQLVAIQESGAALDTFPPIQGNSFIQGLKAELANHQRERAQLAENLGDLHPDMIKVNTAIEASERRLNQEIAKVVESIKNEYKNAQAKEKGLLSALEIQKQEVFDLNQKSIGYGALQRDAAGTQQVFESVLQRVKETELSGQLTVNNARVLDAANVPRNPIWPRKQLNLIGAFLAAALVGVVLVIAFEWLNPRIVNSRDVEETLGLPVLGNTPRIAALKGGPLAGQSLPIEFHEALRGIRTRILLSPIAAGGRTLAVTSARPGEGKTVLASNLAASMALAGRRVLLIDADVRHPQLHRVFDCPISPGLTNILAGEVKALQAVQKSPTIEGLFVLPAGSERTNSLELIDSESLSDLIDGFTQRFDLIVMDCPPVMAVADASIIAHAASSVVFVVSGAPTGEIARAAIERISSVQAQVVGVILNKTRTDHPSAYYYLRDQESA